MSLVLTKVGPIFLLGLLHFNLLHFARPVSFLAFLCFIFWRVQQFQAVYESFIVLFLQLVYDQDMVQSVAIVYADKHVRILETRQS